MKTNISNLIQKGIKIDVILSGNKQVNNLFPNIIFWYKKYQIKRWLRSIPKEFEKEVFNVDINYHLWNKEEFLKQRLNNGTIRERGNKNKIIEIHQWLDKIQGQRTLFHEIGHVIWQRLNKTEKKKISINIRKEIKECDLIHKFILYHYKKGFIFSKKYFEEYFAIKLPICILGLTKHSKSFEKEIQERKNFS